MRYEKQSGGLFFSRLVRSRVPNATGIGSTSSADCEARCYPVIRTKKTPDTLVVTGVFLITGLEP